MLRKWIRGPCFRSTGREIQEYVTTLFEWQGTNTIAAEELAMLPGMDELFGC